jgi:hypothetical protein
MRHYPRCSSVKVVYIFARRGTENVCPSAGDSDFLALVIYGSYRNTVAKIRQCFVFDWFAGITRRYYDKNPQIGL